jgi:parallel beta-helix repeat protein
MRSLAALVFALVVLLVHPALAGPITPPPGPVASTPGPEPRIAINATNTPGDADSLFKITQPGSYYLTGNITGVAGKSGIIIAAEDVWLDLNGFTLRGVPGSRAGINVTMASKKVRISNGFCRDWSISGISMGGSTGPNQIERVTASGNQIDGFSVGNTTLFECTAVNNVQNGITVGTGQVLECVAADNGGSGFSLGGNVLVRGCHASSNASSGFSASGNAHFLGCYAVGNSGSGFSAGAGFSFIDCLAADNVLSGFAVAGPNIGGIIRSCTARFNGLHGITVSNGVLIEGNALYRNGSTGVGAGVHVTGKDNRIEGNNCTGADRGIEVTAAENVIIRNTCSDNSTNWIIAANNVYGPIIDRTAPASAAVSGNSAADATGSTHPNANFTY